MHAHIADRHIVFSGRKERRQRGGKGRGLNGESVEVREDWTQTESMDDWALVGSFQQTCKKLFFKFTAQIAFHLCVHFAFLCSGLIDLLEINVKQLLQRNAHA